MPDESVEMEPLSARLGFLGKIDTAVYRVEVVVCVTALVLMSIMVFADVVYQLAVTISQYLDRGDTRGWTILGGALGFVALMGTAATGPQLVSGSDGDEPADVERTAARPLAVRIGVTIGAVIGSFVFGWALLGLESSTVYQILLVAFSIPIGMTFWRKGSKAGFATYVVAAILGFIAFGSLPGGYSWSQEYSLIMLLWVGFLGASIAARDRRHLRVDLARKLLPPDKLPWFNVASYTVAAAFTAVVLYLGYEYMLGPDSAYLRPIWDPPSWLPEATRTTLIEEFPLPPDAGFVRRAMQVVFAPGSSGQLPDWLKVAAIPVSMLLICLRFLGHAFVFARMAIRGESFTEQTGVH